MLRRFSIMWRLGAATLMSLMAATAGAQGHPTTLAATRASAARAVDQVVDAMIRDHALVVRDVQRDALLSDRVHALWMLPLQDRWQLALAGGPSWFFVGQDLVSDVTVTQTYPTTPPRSPARRRRIAHTRRSDSTPARTSATGCVRMWARHRRDVLTRLGPAR